VSHRDFDIRDDVSANNSSESRLEQETDNDIPETRLKDDLTSLLKHAINSHGQCEGLMLKNLYHNNDSHTTTQFESKKNQIDNSTELVNLNPIFHIDIPSGYEPSRRSLKWLKLKKDYIEGTGDTIEVLVLGVFYGNGKRAGLFGSFLLGVVEWSVQGEAQFQTLCKCMSGFTDKDLADFHEFFKTKTQDKPDERVLTTMNPTIVPDLWIDLSPPDNQMIWEIKGADLQISPAHTAGCGSVTNRDKNINSDDIDDDQDVRGIGLRFPRFIRRRDDIIMSGKQPIDLLTHGGAKIAKMYRQQNTVVGEGDPGSSEDENFD